jgi:hypothetical protein
MARRKTDRTAEDGASSGGGSDAGLLRVPKDEERHPRTEEEMEREARWLASFFEDGAAAEA